MNVGRRPAERGDIEPPVDPSQPIVDAHHHLYDRPGLRYLADDFKADLASGHNILATVFVQARAMYRSAGPEAMRSVGETEFAKRVSDGSKADPEVRTRMCAGIVCHADLLLGEELEPVLQEHVEAAGGPASGSLRGLRHIAAWDPDNALLNSAYPTTRGMLEGARFRSGFALLSKFGLSFDAWLYFHQLDSLFSLAQAFPDIPVVVDHCGGILGIREYAGRRDEIFTAWARALRQLSQCENVSIKLGGLGMPISGIAQEEPGGRPGSIELCAAWRPWMETCIDVFGTARCMFESNFPADRGSHSYGTGWNAMQRLAAGASAAEKDDLFWRTADRVYRLGITGRDKPAQAERSS